MRTEPATVPLIVVVGAGGVGKTTVAAAMGIDLARAGHDTLVMTFDPSLRLKDALGIADRPPGEEVPVEGVGPGRLDAVLLDARTTFDRLIARYSPDLAAGQRILSNRFYANLSGTLSGVLEYMAVERLFEAWQEGRHQRIVLDTPPTRQALDFLQAPQRIVGFLDSGALRIALRPWFDEHGRLRPTRRIGFVGRNVEAFLDRMVGLELLRDMAEFFQSFSPLYDGFRARALEVQQLLRSTRTLFVLVSGPGPERVADTLFFARRLEEAGHRVGPVIVNRVHPAVHPPAARGEFGEGRQLLAWLAARDAAGVAELASLMGRDHPVVEVPLLPAEPTDIEALGSMGADVAARIHAAM